MTAAIEFEHDPELAQRIRDGLAAHAEQERFRPEPCLYFESHVTIAPVFDAARDRATALAKVHGFKLARLLMQKSATGAAEESRRDTFMTGHAARSPDLSNRTKALIQDLKAAGFSVLRYKIEKAVVDSRINDTWGLLA